MALNLPTSSNTVKDRIKTDIQTKVALSNPFMKGSWLRAFAESLGERMYDFYYAITQAIEEIFPDTTLTNLDRWGSFYNISRLAATRGTGTITFQGSTSPILVPIGTKFVDSAGNVYSATESKSTAVNVVVQSTLTASAGIATFTGTTDHNFNSGDSVTISGAVDTLYNGTFAVTPITNAAFTYLISAAAGASTTGGTFTNDSGFLGIRADVAGASGNLSAFTLLNLQASIASIDDGVGIDASGMAGGSDQESTESFRSRLLDIIRNPIAHFNVSDITRVAKSGSLVTRVFVKETTPAAGQVTIYPMSDNELNPIPSTATRDAVKSAILSIKPANVSDADVIVTLPTGVSQAFDFSALNPSSSTMKTAIEANLAQFFAENVEVGVVTTEDSYRAAIQSTVDTVTGDSMISFALTTPAADLTPTASQIHTLGLVTYP